MALDEARTTEDSAADHVADHNTLHKWRNSAQTLLASRKSSADTPDDEFDSTTLDGKWTVVGGSSGTVDPVLAASTATNIYDLSTRPGWLLLQCGTSDAISLRQDYTLPDGYCMVMPVSMAKDHSVQGDNLSMALRLNDDNTGSADGEYVAIMFEQDGAETQVQGNSDTSSGGTEVPTASDVFSNLVYLKIERRGLVYSTWYSMDGFTWSFVYEDTHADVADNVWIAFTGSSGGTYAAIAAIPWIRQGVNGFDPWTWAD